MLNCPRLPAHSQLSISLTPLSSVHLCRDAFHLSSIPPWMLLYFCVYPVTVSHLYISSHFYPLHIYPRLTTLVYMDIVHTLIDKDTQTFPYFPGPRCFGITSCLFVFSTSVSVPLLVPFSFLAERCTLCIWTPLLRCLVTLPCHISCL
jgi:hypothetical protein